MAFYDDELEVNSYTTTFPNGASLTIKLKPNFDSTAYVRQFIARSRAATNLEAKIKELEEKQLRASVDDYEKIGQEIVKLQQRPDQLEVMTDVIFMTGEGWDRYRNKEDEAEGKAVPFTKENIQTMKLTVLNAIVNSLTKTMGLGGEDDPKAQSNESIGLLSSASTVQ